MTPLCILAISLANLHCRSTDGDIFPAGDLQICIKYCPLDFGFRRIYFSQYILIRSRFSACPLSHIPPKTEPVLRKYRQMIVLHINDPNAGRTDLSLCSQSCCLWTFYDCSKVVRKVLSRTITAQSTYGAHRLRHRGGSEVGYR